MMYESELPIYRGSSRKGFGLGGTLTSGIYKYAIPAIKNFFFKYKDDILDTGKQVLHDVAIKNIPVKRSIKRRSKQTLGKILKRSKNKNKTTQKGQGTHKGVKRKRTAISSTVPKKKAKKTHPKRRGPRKHTKASTKKKTRKYKKQTKKSTKTNTQRKDIFLRK